MAKRRSLKNFLEASGDIGAQKIAMEYARGSDDVTISILAEKNNLTEYAVRGILEYAIVHCLVSYNIALMMQVKAHRNQIRHLESERKTPSDNYYENKVFPQRLEFISNFEDEKVKRIVNVFLQSPNLSAINIAESIGLSLKELNVVLIKAIIFNIIDDKTLMDLINLQLWKSSYKDETRTKLNNYVSLRNKYIQITSELGQLYFELDSFDEYAFDEVDRDFEQEKEILIKRIKESEAKLKEIKLIRI